MEPYFPHGLKIVYPFDTTPFTTVAIEEVVKTLFEAVVLVFLIMWLFMGNIRATLIPTIAVPVVLLGTFAVLAAFGYSINMLTMFAMVLAIGLLVDDAIVVVENVERIMSEEGLPPREATAKSMEQITSALVGIALVLAAVFGPMAFFSGSTGVIYRQFSVTIIASMLLSVLVALILTPVLCAQFLKPVAAGHSTAENANFLVRPFLRAFERVFAWVRDRYVRVVGHSIAKKLRYVAVYVVIVTAVGMLYMRLPTGFLPEEDQGSIMTMVTLPVGATTEQTLEVANQVQNYYKTKEAEAVESAMAIIGTGMAGTAQNQGMVFVRLKDWDLRRRDDLSAQAVAGRTIGAFARVRGATVLAFPPPSVIELGTVTGFDAELVDFGGLGHEGLTAARNQLLGMAAQDPRLVRVRPNGLEDVPQYRVDVDWEKAGAMGAPVSSINDNVSALFGSAYVNNFIKSGRVKRVFVQADSPYRMLPADLERVYVRNSTGKMVPYSAFATGRWISGSPRLERFNGFPSMNIQGEPARGRSSGEAMEAMEELVAKLPKGVRLDWNGISYQERMATSQGPILYAFSILVIFLCVAALYESWTIPFVNLLMLPLGVFGALLANTLRGLPNDVYFQIGFLTTLGLSTKNAILIIQFIQAQMAQGEGLVKATLSAVRIRFRPVMMTSLAFFFGTLPLALAHGAGAGAMRGIGTAVTGGMVSATFIDLIFIPMFFVLVSQRFAKRKPSSPGTPVAEVR
jgi:hydrophobe/amphiphile efflux-1 (HAE1) family protein